MKRGLGLGPSCLAKPTLGMWKASKTRAGRLRAKQPLVLRGETGSLPALVLRVWGKKARGRSLLIAAQPWHLAGTGVWNQGQSLHCLSKGRRLERDGSGSGSGPPIGLPHAAFMLPPPSFHLLPPTPSHPSRSLKVEPSQASPGHPNAVLLGRATPAPAPCTLGRRPKGPKGPRGPRGPRGLKAQPQADERCAGFPLHPASCVLRPASSVLRPPSSVLRPPSSVPN